MAISGVQFSTVMQPQNYQRIRGSITNQGKSLSVFTTANKTRFKIQLPVLKNPDIIGKMPTIPSSPYPPVLTSYTHEYSVIYSTDQWKYKYSGSAA